MLYKNNEHCICKDIQLSVLYTQRYSLQCVKCTIYSVDFCSLTWRAVYDSELPLLDAEPDRVPLGRVEAGVEELKVAVLQQQRGKGLHKN